MHLADRVCTCIDVNNNIVYTTVRNAWAILRIARCGFSIRG